MTFYRHVFVQTFPKLQEKYINKQRFYESPNGKLLPSVTTVLSVLSKAGIDAWKKRVGETMADEISKNSMVNGTEMHSVIESFLDNKPANSDNQTSQKLFEQMKPELLKINNIMAQEIQLHSEKLGVAGRVDCIAEYNGVPSVIDFKSASKKKSKSWITSYFLQATAYSLMFEELTHKKIDQIVIIISANDGTITSYVENKDQFVDQLLGVIEDWQCRRDFG